ncbi:MAG TPA: alcohol dehydrogenase catalytic domain-containing protein [Herpetosiphonaceae bacterium]|nr:alcohol dehydrogenase catalytic domain-containing protein [Herpetosiphonaceae bacterium]
MSVETLSTVMQVPQFIGDGRITFAEREVPVPGHGQLLIKVKANALCGSERGQFLKGSEVTPGHEAAGTVVIAVPDTRVLVGTPGVIFLMDYCADCRNCRLGSTNQCLQKRGDMGFTKDGGYGPYELVHEHIFFPVDADIPLAEATMLLDVMGTSSHAIRRARLMHRDIQSVIVAGAGPVGLGMLAMLRVLLGDQVPVLIGDLIPYRLELAARLGGTPIDLKNQTFHDGVREHGGAPIDLAIDTSGKRAARQECLAVLARRGVLVCVGHGESLNLAVSADLIAPERAVLGSEYFCFDELPDLLQHLRTHRAYLQEIITHRYPVARVQEAFEVFFRGETGKVVIEQ